MNWTEALMGKQVTFNKLLMRRKTNGIGGAMARWYPIPMSPQAGMVVGRRWLAEGRIVKSYDRYEPSDWIRTGTVPCIVVVRNSRENPIYVPFDGFELLD